MAQVACILTMAGSDSGGGAGIQADLKTIAALGAYGTSVITALTAQNGLGVKGVHAPDPSFVALQLRTVLEGFPISAAKTGMLFSAPIIVALVKELVDFHHARPGRHFTPFPLVIDPVSVSQTGHALLQDDAVEALITELIPLATLVTPNKPEAELLAGMTIESQSDVQRAIEIILSLGPQAVLLKGGHFDVVSQSSRDGENGHELVDWLGLPGGKPIPLPVSRVHTENTHGTGCTLSAAIAAGLGQRLPVEDAIRRAQEYLTRCLSEGYAPGQGCGPPNHMAGLRSAVLS